MGDGVRLIQPNGKDSEVVAVAQQAVSVAKLRAQAGGCTVKRGQVSAGAFHHEVEGNVVVGDEAGVEAVIANAGGKHGKVGVAAGGEVAAAREPIAVGDAVGVQNDAAVVDDGMLCEGKADTAVGVMVARSSRDNKSVRLPVCEQGLLRRRGVGDGAAVAQVSGGKMRSAGRYFARAGE